MKINPTSSKVVNGKSKPWRKIQENTWGCIEEGLHMYRLLPAETKKEIQMSDYKSFCI